MIKCRLFVERIRSLSSDASDESIADVRRKHRRRPMLATEASVET